MAKTTNSPLDVLEQEYQAKRIELLGKISKETTDILTKLVHSFGKLPTEAQNTFFKSDEGKAALKTFGLTVKESSGGGDGGARVKGETLVATILEIVKESGREGITQADIVKHAKMVELYKSVGKEVSPQANKLSTLVTEGKLKDNGKEGKARKFLSV